MTRKVCLVAVLGLVWCSCLVYAQNADRLTITTYYPSPYGVYRELQLYPASSNKSSCARAQDEGILYFNNLTQQLMVCSSYTVGGNRIWAWFPVPGSGGYWWADSKTPMNIWNTNAGNVGIGTGMTVPAQKLHVAGNAYVTGNVGIGTASPSEKLHVVGNALTTGNSIVNGNVSIGAASPSQKLHVAGNAYVTGNVGIGTASPSEKLHVVGNALVTGDLRVNAGLTLGGVRRTTWPQCPTITVEFHGTSYSNDHRWICCNNGGTVIAAMTGYSTGVYNGDDKDAGVLDWNGNCVYIGEGQVPGDNAIRVWLTCMK